MLMAYVIIIIMARLQRGGELALEQLHLSDRHISIYIYIYIYIYYMYVYVLEREMYVCIYV